MSVIPAIEAIGNARNKGMRDEENGVCRLRWLLVRVSSGGYPIGTVVYLVIARAAVQLGL